MALPLPNVVSDVGPGGALVTAQNALLKNRYQDLINQYYGPNIQSEIGYRNAMTSGQNITNQYLPDKLKLANAYQQLQNQYYGPNIQSEISLRQAQSGLAGSEAAKNNYLVQHPGFMGSDDTKVIQMLMDKGLINKNSFRSGGVNNLPVSSNMPSDQYQNNQIPQNNINYTPIQQQPNMNQMMNGNNPSSNYINNPPPSNQQVPSQQQSFDPAAPYNTGNALVDSILNRKYADTAYRNKMTQGFNWVHLPTDTKDQYVAQGYGMGIDPLKMMGYINKGMSLPQIAQAEGLDPENLPPPIYNPTNATKTRVQQVQQVTHELDYMSSATTPLIKQYAGTFAGVSPDRISDMLNSDPEAQKRFGRYIGALSVQTGLANGRTIAEGGRPGATVMKMVKDSALKGIDQHSPIKMSGVAYEEAQKTINDILQKGATIRTTTGMNPMSDIGKSKNKSGNFDPKSMSNDQLMEIVNG